MHLQNSLFPSPKIADIPTWPIRFLQVENSDILYAADSAVCERKVHLIMNTENV